MIKFYIYFLFFYFISGILKDGILSTFIYPIKSKAFSTVVSHQSSVHAKTWHHSKQCSWPSRHQLSCLSIQICYAWKPLRLDPQFDFSKLIPNFFPQKNQFSKLYFLGFMNTAKIFWKNDHQNYNAYTSSALFSIAKIAKIMCRCSSIISFHCIWTKHFLIRSLFLVLHCMLNLLSCAANLLLFILHNQMYDSEAFYSTKSSWTSYWWKQEID